MPGSGPVPQRRPGDGNDFDRQARPDAQFLGDQSADGGGGPLMAVYRLVRALVARVHRRR